MAVLSSAHGCHPRSWSTFQVVTRDGSSWQLPVKERQLGQNFRALGLERLVNFARSSQGYLCLPGPTQDTIGIMHRQGTNSC